MSTQVQDLKQELNDLQADLAGKASLVETLDIAVQTLESKKRELEATAAAEKVCAWFLSFFLKYGRFAHPRQPQIEADRAQLLVLKGETEVGGP